MAIGSSNLSAKARGGFAFAFGKDGQAWANWEADLIVYLETQGLDFYKKKTAQDSDVIRRIDEAKEKLKLSPDKLVQVETILNS